MEDLDRIENLPRMGFTELQPSYNTTIFYSGPEKEVRGELVHFLFHYSVL